MKTIFNIKDYFLSHYRNSAKMVKVLSLAFLVSVFVMGGVFASSAYATYATSGTIALTSPTGSENWSGTHSITWSYTGLASTTVSILLSSNGGSFNTLVDSIPIASSTYSWNTSSSTDGTQYKIEVLDFPSGVNDHSDTFTVDNTAPTFTINNGTDETGPVQSDTINVTVSDATSGVDSSTLKYGFSTSGTCDSSITYGTLFTSNSDFTIAGDHTDYLCVKATDNAGNVGYKQVGKLNTDNTDPEISSVTGITKQGNGSTPAGDIIKVQFSEPVTTFGGVAWSDELTFWSPASTKLDTSNATFSYDTSSDALTVTLNEATDNTWLKNGDYITVKPNGFGDDATDPSAIQDIAGNLLPLTTVTSSAISGDDNAHPTVALTYSNNGSVKNGDAVTITATFNELLDNTTPKISIAVPGSGDVSSADMTATTNSPLVWTYDWTVANGGDGTSTIAISANDRAGNGNETATNNTIMVDNTAPTVSSVSSDGAFFNAGSHTISVVFSEPLAVAPKIAISTAGSGTDSVTATSMAGTAPTDTWTYGYTVHQPSSDGTATITLSDGADVAGNVMASNGTHTFVIDTTNPTMTISSPIANEVVHNTNGDVQFAFSATDTNLDTCAYEVGTTGSYSTINCTSPGTLILNDGRQTVTLKATDKAGNTNTDSVNFVVDTDGILTVAKTGNPDFSTIQGAIDAWVTGITTIQVADGNYPENVNVNQALLIKGPNAEIDPNDTSTSRTDEAVISSTGGTAVTISADNVTIDGFTITNPSGETGIYSNSVGNVNIVNNIFHQIGTNTTIIGHAQAVDVHTGSSDVSTFLIKGNAISNIGNKNSGTAKGIYLGDSSGSGVISDVTIKDNHISDINSWNTTNSIGHGAYGILINHKITGAQITGNTISNLDGLWAHGIGLEGNTPNAVVTGNNIYNLTDHKNPSDAVAIWAEDNPSISSVAVHNNKFSDVTFGVAINPFTAIGVLDATNNWWGDATGPYNEYANPHGLGVRVWPVHMNVPYIFTYLFGLTDAGAPTQNYVVFNPFYNNDTPNGTDGLVSSGPIHSLLLSFNPNSQTVNNNSTLTVTAKDANGFTVVNDSTTQLTLTGDNGASFGANLLTMDVLGSVNTTITNSNVGQVNVTATEAGGPATGAGTINFTAGSDVTPPVISNIQATSITSSSATITWTTDESASSQVEYGIASSYGSQTSIDNSLTTDHSVSITGLTSGTVYHFRVLSDDNSNNKATSGDNTFTTASVDNTPPVITLLGQNPMTLTVDDTFTDPGATANDNVDGDITSSIVKTGTVNTATAGTYTITYNVSDSAGNSAVEETRTVIVINPAVSPVIPTVVLNGDSIVSSYTQSEANTRFTNGLQFDITNVASMTVNGTNVTVGTPSATTATVATVTKANATTLGLHVYNVVVTSLTGDTANITVSYTVTPDFNDSAVLAVTGVDAVKTYAVADDTYTNGWSWTFHITVPTDETTFKMKFSDFISGSNSIPAGNNIRFYSAQSSDSNSESSATTITSANTYSSPITLNSDLESGTAGRQIDVVVEMKVPTGTAGGSYSASYGVQSN